MVIARRIFAGILAALVLYAGVLIGKYMGRRETMHDASLVFIGENEYILSFSGEEHLYVWEGLGNYVRNMH